MKRRLTLLATAVGVASLVSACMGDATGPASLEAPAGVFSADTYQTCVTLWAGHHVAESELGIPQGATVTYGPADGTGREISWCVDVTEGGYDPNALCDHTNWWQPHCDEVPLQFFIVDQWTTGGGGGGGGGGSGGSGGDPSYVDPSACDYLSPPKPDQPGSCNLSFTAADLQKIEAARQYVRAQSEFTDTDARDDCAAILVQMNAYLGSTKFFRGAIETPHRDHAAATYRKDYAHIEPSTLAEGGRLLLWALMHETIHINGSSHPNDVAEPYSTHPFNRVRLDAGANSCLK